MASDRRVINRDFLLRSGTWLTVCPAQQHRRRVFPKAYQPNGVTTETVGEVNAPVCPQRIIKANRKFNRGLVSKLLHHPNYVIDMAHDRPGLHLRIAGV